MVDAITAGFLAAAAVGACAAVAHMLGYVPPRYKRVLGDLQSRFASQVGVEVENALERVAVRQEAKYRAEATAAMAQAQSAETSQRLTMTGALGNAAQLQNRTTRMLAEGMMGSWLPILRTVLPSVADQLEENPELIFSLIENPFFKKHILPRVQQFLGSQTESGSDKNPFLEGLRT